MNLTEEEEVANPLDHEAIVGPGSEPYQVVYQAFKQKLDRFDEILVDMHVIPIEQQAFDFNKTFEELEELLLRLSQEVLKNRSLNSAVRTIFPVMIESFQSQLLQCKIEFSNVNFSSNTELHPVFSRLQMLRDQIIDCFDFLFTATKPPLGSS